MKSKFVAISGISASFVAIILTLGAYIEFLDIFAIVLSSVFVILPLYFGSIKGCFLTFFAGGVVSLLCGLGNITSIVYPAYFTFFGLYPIIKFLAKEKNFNKKIFIILSIIWCVGVCYFLFFYYTQILMLELERLPEFVEKYIWYFIALYGVVFYFIYDRFIFVVKTLEDRYLQRIIR